MVNLLQLYGLNVTPNPRVLHIPLSGTFHSAQSLEHLAAHRKISRSFLRLNSLLSPGFSLNPQQFLNPHETMLPTLTHFPAGIAIFLFCGRLVPDDDLEFSVQAYFYDSGGI